MLTPVVCGLPRTEFAENTGGALLNAGAMEIKDTVFAENTATGGGLAIQNLEPHMALSNVTFNGNIRSCPSSTYSYTQHVSMHRLPCQVFRQTYCRRKKAPRLLFTPDIYHEVPSRVGKRFLCWLVFLPSAAYCCRDDHWYTCT